MLKIHKTRNVDSFSMENEELHSTFKKNLLIHFLKSIHSHTSSELMRWFKKDTSFISKVNVFSSSKYQGTENTAACVLVKDEQIRPVSIET